MSRDEVVGPTGSELNDIRAMGRRKTQLRLSQEVVLGNKARRRLGLPIQGDSPSHRAFFQTFFPNMPIQNARTGPDRFVSYSDKLDPSSIRSSGPAGPQQARVLDHAIDQTSIRFGGGRFSDALSRNRFRHLPVSERRRAANGWRARPNASFGNASRMGQMAYEANPSATTIPDAYLIDDLDGKHTPNHKDANRKRKMSPDEARARQEASAERMRHRQEHPESYGRPRAKPQTKTVGAETKVPTHNDVAVGVRSGNRVGRTLLDGFRDAIVEVASLEKEDVRRLLGSTLSKVRGGASYMKSSGFDGILENIEGLWEAKDQTGPKSPLKADIRSFKNLLTTIDEGVTSPDRRFLVGMLDMVDSPDQLYDAVVGVDPVAAKTLKQAGSHRNVSVLRKFLRDRIDTAKNLDLIGGSVEDFVGDLNKTRLSGTQRNRVVNLIDMAMNKSNKFIRDAADSRSRHGIFHANIGGITQTVKVGGGKDGPIRRFSIAGGYDSGSVFRGMKITDQLGRVQSGIINGLSFTRESLQSFVDAAQGDVSSVVGFDMRTGQLPEVRFMDVTRGYNSSGKNIMGKMGHIIFQMQADDLHNLERQKRHAFARQFQLDIETSYGKRRWSRKAEALMGRGVEGLDEAVGGYVSSFEQSMDQQLIDAITGGNADEVDQVVRRMRGSRDVNWITQIAARERVLKEGAVISEAGFHEFETVSGSLFDVGGGNTGAHAARRVSDLDFESFIETLSSERIKQAHVGGAITGLNVDKFDMRVIRTQAWRMGEQALVQSQNAKISANTKARLEKKAARLLTYSGRKVGDSWRAYDGVGAVEAINALNKKAGSALFSVGQPIADALQVSDVTSNLVRPLLGVSMYTKGKDRLNAARPRISEHVFGSTKGGRIRLGDGSEVESMTLRIFKTDKDEVVHRLGSMVQQIDEADWGDIILKARDNGAPEEIVDALDGYYRSYRDTKFGSPAEKKALDIAQGLQRSDVNKVVKQLKQHWGDLKVKGLEQKVYGSFASQESMTYAISSIWNALKGGLADDSGAILGQAAHSALPDLSMINIAISAAYGEATKTKKFVGGAMNTVSEEVAEIIENAGIRIPVVSRTFDDDENPVGLVLKHSMIKDGNKGLLQAEVNQLLTYSYNFVHARAKNTASAADKWVERQAGSQAAKLAEVIGEANIAKITRRVKFGYGVAGLAAVAAGTIVAGTVQKKAHADDDVWRYGETEDPKARKIQKQRTADTGMGTMVTEMSKRKNYSYNMRPDKHKHLFGGN